MKAETEVVLAVLAYSFCSGTLVLLNKLILHHLPFPSLVISIQLIAALMFIGVAKFTGKLQVDPIKWVYVKPYLVYTVAFSMGVFCNMKSLSISNVETVIVFRALSPCIVSFLDAIFLGREYPTARSWSALGLIVLGTIGYASFDVKFQTQGMAAYAWPIMYLIVISFEMAYGKRIIQSVDLKTFSGPVLYTNVRYVLRNCRSLLVVHC
jgi:drug/metabolite transporter (DMT)-like permease